MKGTRIPQWIINQQDFGTMVFRFFVSSLKMPIHTHPITAITDCVGSWQISSRSAAERTPSEPWHSSPGGDSFNLGTCKKPSFFMAEMSFQVLPFVGITCCVYHAICGTTMFFVASRYYPMLYFDLAMAQKLGNQCLLNVLYTCYPLVI